ncbi:MAG TPA: PLDc N-terminal domain-containing protein [Gemmataceae bacterium]|nr:PLDc N-terminal domain-containing protein [Gemmataceae bacterium]
MHDLILFAQDDAGARAAGGFFSLMCVFWIIGIIASIFWIWMLIDALIKEPTTNEKILWFLVIFFLHFIGALIYFFVRRSGRGRRSV